MASPLSRAKGSWRLRSPSGLSPISSVRRGPGPHSGALYGPALTISLAHVWDQFFRLHAVARWYHAYIVTGHSARRCTALSCFPHMGHCGYPTRCPMGRPSMRARYTICLTLRVRVCDFPAARTVLISASATPTPAFCHVPFGSKAVGIPHFLKSWERRIA